MVPILELNGDGRREFAPRKSPNVPWALLTCSRRAWMQRPAKCGRVPRIRSHVVNMAKEVEEWVVTGAAFRTPTAVQPPRAIHVGLRLLL